MLNPLLWRRPLKVAHFSFIRDINKNSTRQDPRVTENEQHRSGDKCNIHRERIKFQTLPTKEHSRSGCRRPVGLSTQFHRSCIIQNLEFCFIALPI